MPKGSSRGQKNEVIDTILQRRPLPKNLRFVTSAAKKKRGKSA